MFDDARWTRRRPGAGLLLLLVLVAAMAWPLWHWRHLGHPLTGADHVELCTSLRAVPELAGWRAVALPSRGSAGACEWRDAGDRPRFEATLVTTRSASRTEPVRLDRYYETWRDEVRASGVDASDEAEHDGVRTFAYRRGDTREWLREDHGVLLSLRSGQLDDATLAALGDRIGRELRAIRN